MTNNRKDHETKDLLIPVNNTSLNRRQFMDATVGLALAASPFISLAQGTTTMKTAATNSENNHVWFITGANRGIGAAIAKAALDAGKRVVATARRPEDIQKNLGPSDNLLCIALDITNHEQAQVAVQSAIDHFGQIDVLINNAGFGQLGYFEETSEDAIKRQFDVNVYGTMRVTREVLPHMRLRHSGHIMTITSIAGVLGAAGGSVYSASKFALTGWMESMNLELASLGIHVTTIEPGFFRTDFLDTSSASYTEPKIADYTVQAKEFRDYHDNMNRNQSGAPAKLAAALLTLVSSKNVPTHFIAGADALERIEKELLQRRQKEISDWGNLSGSLAHDN